MNQTAIKKLSNNCNFFNIEPIEVTPTEVFFHKIQTENTYEIAVYVKNLTKKARRIRVFQPKNQKFRCDYDIKGPIAAGLHVKLIVRYIYKLAFKHKFQVIFTMKSKLYLMTIFVK